MEIRARLDGVQAQKKKTRARARYQACGESRDFLVRAAIENAFTRVILAPPPRASASRSLRLRASVWRKRHSAPRVELIKNRNYVEASEQAGGRGRDSADPEALARARAHYFRGGDVEANVNVIDRKSVIAEQKPRRLLQTRAAAKRMSVSFSDTRRARILSLSLAETDSGGRGSF